MHPPTAAFGRRLRRAGLVSLLLASVSLPPAFAIDRVGTGVQHSSSASAK